jgi:hypothetical protein
MSYRDSGFHDIGPYLLNGILAHESRHDIVPLTLHRACDKGLVTWKLRSSGSRHLRGRQHVVRYGIVHSLGRRFVRCDRVGTIGPRILLPMSLGLQLEGDLDLAGEISGWAWNRLYLGSWILFMG